MIRLDDLLAKSCGQVNPISLLVRHQEQGDVSKYVVNKPYAVIGRHEACDICISNEKISKQHVYLQILDGRLFCVDQGSRAGIFWQDMPRLYGWLNPAESIKVGPYHVTLEQPVGIEPHPAREVPNTAPFYVKYVPHQNAKAQLEVNESQTFLLRYQMALIGRTRHCNVVLDSEEIAPIHASIVRTKDAKYWLIVPMGHVKVNGHRCQSYDLQDGDVIKIGKHIIRFKITATADKPFHTGQITDSNPDTPRLMDMAASAGDALSTSSLNDSEATGKAIELPRQNEAIVLPARALIISKALPAVVASNAHQPALLISSSPGRSALVKQTSHLATSQQAKVSRPLAQKKAELSKKKTADEMQLMDTLMQHMKQMQQDMMQQMRMNMEMMAEFMVNLQQQQMDMVREELAQLARVNQELAQLRQCLPTAAPDKVEAYKLTISNDSVKSITPQASKAEPVQPKKNQVHGKSPAQTEDLPKDEETPQRHSHTWISQRIAVLENERKSRWEKMKTAVLGK